MSVKIVAYDLTKPKYYYKDLINAIGKYKNARITDSLWFINTEENCQDVFRNLEIYVDLSDRLFIHDISEKEVSCVNLLSTREEFQSLFG